MEQKLSEVQQLVAELDAAIKRQAHKHTMARDGGMYKCADCHYSINVCAAVMSGLPEDCVCDGGRK